MKEVDKGVNKMTTTKIENSTLKDVDTVCENGKKKGKSERLPTKVVVRRLPPTMTKETFLQQCSPLPPVDYLYFVQADMSLAPQCFSRAYLNFVNHQDIFTFTQKFDNYVFVDAKGQEYPAVVEFAPFQRIPKRRPTRKKDSKMGTIESSPIYISFKEKLETEIQENKSSANSIKQHFFETSTISEEKKEVSSTPLLDFIRTRKAERQRIRDEKREEKRKRDLERRRAKDEMRKLKKDDESPVVKVLHGSTFGKEKPKDKEINKSTVKKRSDEFVKPLKDKSSVENRSRENKGRVGKSYQEERQRQAERKEEQRKKSASVYQSTTMSESKTCVNESTKQDKPEKEKEKSEITTEEKPAPLDNKIRETDRRKNERTYNKRDEVRRSTQKLDTRRETDDGGRKRGRGPERFSYSHRKDDDKRDDFYGGGRRKPNNDNKKSQEYTSYADKNKDRLRGRLNQKKNLEQTVDLEKVKSNQKEKSEEVSKNNSKDDTVSADKTENSKKESDETKGRLEPENSIKESEPPENRLFKLGVKLKMLNESNTLNNKNKLKRRNSLESGPDHTKSKSEEQSKELGSECKRRNSVGSDNYSQKEEYKDIEKVENPSSATEKNNEERSSENVKIKLAVVKDETCDNTNEVRSGKNVQGHIETEQKEAPRRRKSMEEKSGDLVTAGLESGVLIARRNSLESGELSQKSNDSFKSKSISKLSKEDAEQRSNKDPRSERRIRNKDRPTMELYRPGMGRFSKQRLEREKVLGSSTEVDSPSSSPSPTPVSKPKFPVSTKEN